MIFLSIYFIFLFLTVLLPKHIARASTSLPQGLRPVIPHLDLPATTFPSALLVNRAPRGPLGNVN